MTAILGEHDVTVHEGVEKNCRISKTVQHPGYNGQTKHDMMLAQIKCNVCFSLLSAENPCMLQVYVLRLRSYNIDEPICGSEKSPIFVEHRIEHR